MGETIGEEGSVREPARSQTQAREQHRSVQAQVQPTADGQARKDMLSACRDSRHAGKLVEKLAENLAVQVNYLQYSTV